MFVGIQCKVRGQKLADGLADEIASIQSDSWDSYEAPYYHLITPPPPS